MNELEIFKNEEFGEIRTVMKDGEPMFCLADICKALEIKNASMTVSRLDSDEVTKLASFPKTIDTINPGTYEVIHIAYDKRGNSSEFSQIIEVVATNKVNLQKYTLIIIVNVAMFSYLGYLIYQDKKYINFDNK